ncbi:MAG: response regulator transcription factor [Limnobacter sp.]|uniref:response regulator transcription factor n=1 Tax=unclassified Limnobacter TaxID=2630203 RepID=UPI0025C0C104|nr:MULTISPECIES: response regulator transcription factor [unclassified Limnobacter]|tara:strand:+ start:5054 stop:5764 length:711 start_codon:yes stop_codon:yes gene_type:complete
MPLESRIILVDDHAAVRAGYKRFIDSETDLIVVGEAGNADQAFVLLKTQACDALVLDISMPGQSGLELIKRVRLKWPKLALVVLSMHDSPVVASKALEQGARAYVTKSSEPEELIQGIRMALGEQTFVSGDVQSQGMFNSTGPQHAQENLQQHTHATQEPATTLTCGLTPREVDVVRLLVEGHTIEQVAVSLGISGKTVSNNLSHIRQKLGVQTDFELAFWAWSQGFGRKPPGFGE